MFFSRAIPLLALALSIVPSAFAAPIPLDAVEQLEILDRRATFVEQSYDTFQISDGVAGNAQAEANAILTPFSGRDLSTVSSAELTALQNMREAAETAETAQFNPAIAAASGAAKTALQNGKIKNKVLKLTLEVQGLQIQAAQGKNTASQITAETTKLNNNIALDTKAAGQASKGVV